MLNPFPLQFLALLAYFILRICVGGILLYLGRAHLKQRSGLITVLKFPFLSSHHSILLLVFFELALGTFIFLGAHTQYATLGVILLSLFMLFMKRATNHPLIPPRIFYVLLIGACVSLFITGAGAFAFDLPL